MTDRIILPNSDEAFFAQHPDRKARIRKLLFVDEFEAEFRTLRGHAYDRRRIIALRVQPGPLRGQPIICIPFLLFADETIADDDKTLLPIVDEMMRDAAKSYGMKPKRH